MENKNLEEFKNILKKEDELLKVTENLQADLRKSVREKNWTTLIETISNINLTSDEFQKIDSKRDEIQENLKTDELTPFSEQIQNLRSRLLKCSLENKALGEYISVTRAFLEEVLEKAVSNTGVKTYSKSGIVQPKIKSVVLDKTL